MTRTRDNWSEIAAPLLVWFAENARRLPWRDDPAPYRVWVSEIMLQQTRVEAVKPYFARFMEAFPDIPSLARAEPERLLKLWEGLGYYSRARNLQRAAQMVTGRYGGVLPRSPEELRKLPGVGSYTAGAVASIAYGVPAPAVDGNVLRVYARVTASEKNVSEPAVRRAVEAEVLRVMPEGRAGDFNQALMELGATVCLPNGAPSCGACPLAGLCGGRALGIAETLPVKTKKKARRVQERTIFLLVSGGEAAIRKRPARGLLAGLWEFPGEEGFLSEEGAAETLEQWGARVRSLRPLPEARHIFTHVEWHMRGWWAEVEEIPPGFTPAGRLQIRERYALPAAFRAYAECFTT